MAEKIIQQESSNYLNRRVTDRDTANLQLITQGLEQNNAHIVGFLDLLSDGLDKTDKLLPVLNQMKKVAEEKKDAETRIEEMRQLAQKTEHSDPGFNKLKQKLIRLKSIHQIKKEEWQLLKYLEGKVKHHHENDIIRHIQQYSEFYIKKLKTYSETELLNEIIYILHIISGKEHSWLQGKIDALPQFIVDPDVYSKRFEAELLEQHMSQDEDLLVSVRKSNKRAAEHNPNLRVTLKQMREQIQREVPDSNQQNSSYRFSDVSAMAAKMLTILREVQKADPEISKMLKNTPQLRHLLTYNDEVKDLLAHLSTIPGSEAYLKPGSRESLPNELIAMSSFKSERDWKTFRKFYDHIEKKDVKTVYLDRYGDDKTYKKFVATKKQYRLWPKMWAQVMAEQLKGLYDTSSANSVIIAARNNLLRLLMLREQMINKELETLSSDIKKALESKLHDIGKDSEKAVKDLEKTLESRLTELTEPAEKMLSKLKSEVKKTIDERRKFWRELEDSYVSALDEFNRFSMVFGEHSAKLANQIPNEAQVMRLVDNTLEQRNSLYNDLFKGISALEYTQQTDNFKFKPEEWQESFSSRTNRLEASRRTLDEIGIRMKQFYEGEGYAAFSRLYALGWRTYKLQREIIQSMQKFGIFEVLENKKKTIESPQIKPQTQDYTGRLAA